METNKGKLIRWFDNKGFGFIKPEQGKGDIFIHISALKGMSRKPIVGDVIHYQISVENSGKTRAVNAKIEGVSPELTLTPIKESRAKKGASALAKRNSYRKPKTTNKPRKHFSILVFLIILGVAVFIYSKIEKEQTFIDLVKTSVVEIQPTRKIEQFQCQGKTWCSEMTSCEEATFYLNNCPGTNIDGDGDGTPCESQWCGGLW